MKRATEKGAWLSSRIKPGSSASTCAILGCGKPTMRAASEGLAPFHCRRHIEHRARHGSLWRRSYRASELAPYLKAATSYLATRLETDPHIRNAVSRLTLLLEQSPYEIATRLRGMSAKHRALIALGRLRRKGIKPSRLLAVHLAVSVLMDEDPHAHRVREVRLVQVAKALHRIQSGYHRVWLHQDKNGREVRIELQKFARSSGCILRIMGQHVEELCEVATAEHMQSVLALKIRKYGRHPALPQA